MALINTMNPIFSTRLDYNPQFRDKIGQAGTWNGQEGTWQLTNAGGQEMAALMPNPVAGSVPGPVPGAAPGPAPLEKPAVGAPVGGIPPPGGVTVVPLPDSPVLQPGGGAPGGVTDPGYQFMAPGLDAELRRRSGLLGGTELTPTRTLMPDDPQTRQAISMPGTEADRIAPRFSLDSPGPGPDMIRAYGGTRSLDPESGLVSDSPAGGSGIGDIGDILTQIKNLLGRGIGYDPAGPKSIGYDPNGPLSIGYDPAGPKSIGYDPNGPLSIGYSGPSSIDLAEELNKMLGIEKGGLGTTLRGLGEGQTTLGTGQTDIINKILGIDTNMGGRFTGVEDLLKEFGAGQTSLTDLLKKIPTAYQGPSTGDISGAVLSDPRFAGLSGGVTDLGTGQKDIINQILGLGTGLGDRITNQGAEFEDSLSGLGEGQAGLTNLVKKMQGETGAGQMDIINKILGLSGQLGPGGDIQTRLGDISTGLGGVSSGVSGLGDRFDESIMTSTGAMGAKINDVQKALEQAIANAGGSKNIAELIQSGEGFKLGNEDTTVAKPAVLSSLETLLQGRLSGDVTQDPRVQLQLSDLGESQTQRRNQRIEDLKRLGIWKDDGASFDAKDKLSEMDTRERLQVLANAETLRNSDINSALGLGNLQGGLATQDVGFGLDAAGLGLSERLGLGNLGVREKEANANISRTQAAIEDAKTAREQANLSNLVALMGGLGGSDGKFGWDDILKIGGSLLPFL